MFYTFVGVCKVMKKKIICVILSFVCFGMVGCGEKTEKQTEMQIDSQPTILTSEDNSNGDEELVSVKQFIEKYNLSEAEAKKHDIEGFIEYHKITESKLDTRNWMASLEKEEKAGISFSNTVYRQVTSIETRKASDADVFSDAKYIVIETEIIDSEGMIESSNAVIDMENYKIYKNCDYNNICKCEGTVDIDKDMLDSIMQLLDEMELSTWEENVQYARENNDYWWDLHIIMKMDDVIRYTGNIPGNNKLEDNMKFIIEKIQI